MSVWVLHVYRNSKRSGKGFGVPGTGVTGSHVLIGTKPEPATRILVFAGIKLLTELGKSFIKYRILPGLVPCAFNPSVWEAEAGGSLKVCVQLWSA